LVDFGGVDLQLGQWIMPGGINGVHSYMETLHDWMLLGGSIYGSLDGYNVLLGLGLPYLLFHHNESHKKDQIFPTKWLILDDQ
jgi:hypothetical protein